MPSAVAASFITPLVSLEGLDKEGALNRFELAGQNAGRFISIGAVAKVPPAAAHIERARALSTWVPTVAQTAATAR